MNRLYGKVASLREGNAGIGKLSPIVGKKSISRRDGRSRAELEGWQGSSNRGAPLLWRSVTDDHSEVVSRQSDIREVALW